MSFTKSKPRRLTPEKLKIVTDEFDCRESICHSFDSDWATTQHVVLKNERSGFCPCEDYRILNSVTPRNKYPVRNMRDFTQTSHGKTVFPTLDLHQAFRQIPACTREYTKKNCNNHTYMAI